MCFDSAAGIGCGTWCLSHPRCVSVCGGRTHTHLFTYSSLHFTWKWFTFSKLVSIYLFFFLVFGFLVMMNQTIVVWSVFLVVLAAGVVYSSMLRQTDRQTDRWSDRGLIFLLVKPELVFLLVLYKIAHHSQSHTC